MKWIIVLIPIFLCGTNFVFGQITFHKSFGYWADGNAVHQTSDAGYIIGGNQRDHNNDEHFYLVKTDLNGDTLWTRTFGQSYQDLGYSTQQTSDGGYVIAGRSIGLGGVGVFLVKLNSNGNIVWSKIYFTPYGNYGYSVQQTSDGGYILTGAMVGMDSIHYDVSLIKTDSMGNLLWAKCYGGASHDYGHSVKQTTDGGFIITGSTYSFGAGAYDIYLIKTDSIGNLQWSKTFGDNYINYGYSVQQTFEGGFIVAGYNVTTYPMNSFLIKTNSSGNLTWMKTYDNPDGEDRCVEVIQNPDRGFAFIGFAYMTDSLLHHDSIPTTLVKTDYWGNLLWAKIYGNSHVGSDSHSLSQTSDGGFIITGDMTDLPDTNFNVLLIKTDANGNSNCSESNYPVIVAPAVMQVSNPATVVFNPTITVSNPTTEIEGGSLAYQLCSNVIPTNIDGQLGTINSFSIFPNPAASEFKIENAELKIEKVEMYNLMGEKIFSQQPATNSQRLTINIADFTPGVYFVRLSNDKTQITKKVIIQH